jgi:putative transcriptional regulator
MKNGLRVLRAQRSWSQAELAERLGVSRQTVNAIETARYDPSLPLAFKIATTFNKAIEEIFQPDSEEEDSVGRDRERHTKRS